MNRIYKSLLAILLAALSAGRCAAAESSLQSVLEGRYAAMKTATDAKDRQALAAFLTPDFVSVDVSGKSQTAEQMLAQLVTSSRNPNRVSETTLLSVQLKGDVATVSQRFHVTSTKVTSDGSRHPVELTTLSTDTWVRSGGSWLLQKTVTEELDSSVDGKARPHQVRPQTP